VQGLGPAVRIAALTLVLQPALVAMRLSQTSGSANRIRLSVVLLLVPLILFWIVCGVMIFLTETWEAAAGLLGVVAVTSLACLWAHRWAWARGKFDLLSTAEAP
jgi:protein-S-isoprenylcysteine O-methyltransferase Ste14